MGRIVFAVMLVLALGQVLAADLEAPSGACVEICSDDSTEDRCAPTCADCACCVHAVRPQMTDSGVRLPPPPSSRRAVVTEPSIAFSSDPRDIFHVPKRSLV
jgi:hypothetical protein